MNKQFLTGRVKSGLSRTCSLRLGSLIAPLLLLSACTEEPSVRMVTNQSGGLSFSFTPPEMLTQSRAINQSELRLSVKVNQKEYLLDIEPGSDSTTLSIPVARGQSLDIAVTWSELYEEVLLPLADVKKSTTIPVNAEAVFVVGIGTGSYWTGFDWDKDKISNLDERNNGTDPMMLDILDDPIVQVPIKLMAKIPEQLKDVDGDIDDTLFAVAIVDRVLFPLNREGDIWVDEVNKPANSDVLITYSFYSSIKPNVKLANWENRVNSGETGTVVDISSNEYDYEIDIDGDGTSNLQEIIQGTNPEDKNDPKLAPCDISNFEVGCNTDSDGDGTPDSVETQNADEDGDSIPDYKESKNDDADDDGFHAELDKDETDPCVPNDKAITCDETDSTQPPVDDPADDAPAEDDPPNSQPPVESLLSYEMYEGNFGSTPDFSGLTPVFSGTAAVFSLPPNNGANNYALRFTGKLFVEEAGDYTFYSESNDGSLLYIDGNLIVDNDSSLNFDETSGVRALSAGLHDIVLEYFQNDGSENLTVSWSSSTIAKEPIPEAVLFAP